jgi:hypothetical protein
VSLHRAAVSRSGSWDYRFLPSRGIRRQYLSAPVVLMRKSKEIYNNRRAKRVLFIRIATIYYIKSEYIKIRKPPDF